MDVAHIMNRIILSLCNAIPKYEKEHLVKIYTSHLG